jgi:hypothetical protein
LTGGDRRSPPPDRGSEFGRRAGGGLSEARVELVCAPGDRLATASGRVGGPREDAVLTGEDGGRGEDPGANR